MVSEELHSLVFTLNCCHIVISTFINIRAKGMSLHKIPLFAWAVVITAVLLLLSLPVLAGSLLLCRLKIWLFAGTSF
ncbi:MAG: hypothetical protein EOP34_01035 [Rickettsiales bacterium]|nr:MAG: hypothetical protein EOP34_01035 [Rickettsiales bacterium]